MRRTGGGSKTPANPGFVKNVFERLFGGVEEAEELYGELLSYEGKETHRVRLAILMLSDGESEKMRHYIGAAKIDYRDVLAWAEYPEQLTSGSTRYNTPPEEYEAILARDRGNYLKWIESVGGSEEEKDDTFSD